MLNLPLVLHIGYHKTATTYLQECVFNNHPEIFYLGRPWLNEEIRNFFVRYKFSHDLNFDPVLFKKDFEDILKRILDNCENKDFLVQNKKIFLISHESLHSGPEWFGIDVTNRAKRLNTVFPFAKIIIGIRNQIDYIESNYKQYIHLGGKLGFKKFLYESFACNYCLLPKLQYDRVISLYRNLFGNNSVYAYFQEDLKKNPERALSNIMKFLEVSPDIQFKQAITNKSQSNVFVHLLRIFNKFLANDYNEQYYHRFIGKQKAKEYVRWRLAYLLKKKTGKTVLKKISNQRKLLRKAEVQFIKGYFCESNKKLSILLKRDIRDLGYYYEGQGFDSQQLIPLPIVKTKTWGF